MRTRDLIEGLQTLMPYYDNQNGYYNDADHDVFYAGATDRPLSDEDVDKMIALGWQQEYDERDYDQDFSRADYLQCKYWICYA